jgi:hypothetical protein
MRIAAREQDADGDVSGAPLAALVYDQGIWADAILARSARIRAALGVRLGSVAPPNIERPGRAKCAMRLTDLASGEEIAISQYFGEVATVVGWTPPPWAKPAWGASKRCRRALS